MASATIATTGRTEWALSNPWPWMLAALAASGLGLLQVRLFEDAGLVLRLFLVGGGVLAAGVALTLRLQANRPAFLDELAPARRSLALLALTAGSLLLVGWAGMILIFALSNIDIPWGLNGVILLWALVFPIGTGIAFYAYHRQATGLPFGVRAEGAALLLLAATVFFMGSWALYVDNLEAENWDTIRLALAVAALTAIVAVPLVALPQTPRRVLISLFVVFHFGGITTAILSPAPAPWLVNQVYVRVYRPYLEFMYLTNAYRFYAPEPGPSNYFWCRLEYENAKGEKHWHWEKFPKVDDQGAHAYPISLNYQRRIAMSDNIQGWLSPPAATIMWHGRMMTHPAYYWRAVNSPTPPEPLVGRPNPKPNLVVPYHPDAPAANQYKPATQFCRFMMESYARHIASIKHPDHPDDKVVSVKIYWVTHVIPLMKSIADGLIPGDPTTFYAYYQGRFDANGKLMDEPCFDQDGNLLSGDPLLYWLLPILHEDALDQKSPVQNWVYRHAGDTNWYRGYDQTTWGPAPSRLESREP